MKTHRTVLAIAIAASSSPGCDSGADPVAPGPVPVFEAAAAARNPGNALAVTVTVHVRDADSVAVRFQLADVTASGARTPAVHLVNGTASVPVLGLLPDRDYLFQAVAYGTGGSALSSALELRTDTLPADLPSFSAGGADPSPGFVVLAAGNYGVVIDNTGRVVWYHRFATGPGLNFVAQPTGRFYARPLGAQRGEPPAWVEIDPTGAVTRTFGCSFGLQPRFHDVIAEPDGSYWLLCDETRVLDLAAMGGVADARVTATAVQHISADGTLLFHWSPFDHFDIGDLDLHLRNGTNVNWTHGNGLDRADDGNLLVSFRNLREITKIDVQSGAVIWRLGGARSDFAFLQTAQPPFVGQHSVRAGPSSNVVLLLDNLGDPNGSRAERYELNEAARTARLVHAHASEPAVVGELGGSVQHLPGGRMLVSFGSAGRVEEFDASGRSVWRLHGDPGYVFRAQRIVSLYAPGVGTTR